MMKKLILFFIYLFINLSCFSQSKEITLEKIWKEYTFYPKNINKFKSTKNGNHYLSLIKNNNGQEIIMSNYTNGKKIKTLFKSAKFKIEKINDFKLSKNEEKILLFSKTNSIYRYSKESHVYIYDLKTDKIQQLCEDKVMYASFSPSSDKVAYVLKNNLFIKDLKSNKINQITNDGKKNHIINGASDWVYEEEFKLSKCYEWSSNGDNIAYYKFDESHVEEFSLKIYNNSLYPSQKSFKYPKAGEANSTIKIYNFNLENKKHKLIYTEKDYEYYPRIKWTLNPNQLSIIGMNRHQNELDFIITDIVNGENKIIFTEKDRAYIDIHDNLTFLPENNFIWTSEKDGYNHIYIKNFDGTEIQVTKGKWEVTNFHGINSDNMDIYFTSTKEGSINRTLFKKNLITEKTEKLSSNTGFNESFFSNNFKYYLNSYSNSNTAPYYSVNNNSGDIIRVIEDNKDFNSKMTKYNLSEKEFFEIESEQSKLNAWMIKPPDFNKDKKYPLFMLVYGGPGSQKVTNQFGWNNYFWHQMLAQKGYIVVCIDNRGTGGKGSEFKKTTYKKLGKLETIDQINAAKYLGNLNYIDKNRIGIQGWSYGGYISSLCITKGADIFKMAIAIAPVTNWRFYDNIYTERYMQKPSENRIGYDDNSPINHVKQLKGDFLIVHGSADDNVHLQNTMEMVSALVKEDKDFDLLIYPDKNHGIYGGNTRYHLYKKLTNYILRKL